MNKMIAYKESNTIGLRVEVLRNGGVFTTLEPYTYPEIQNTASSALKMSLRGSFLPVDPEKLPEDIIVEQPIVSITEKPEGASYGFSYDSERDMMVSGNNGVSSSGADCRIDVESKTPCTLVLECINSGEDNYDYGVIYAVDFTPSMGVFVSGEVYKNFADEAINILTTVSIPIPAGEHFVHIKYIKDSSNNSFDDIFAFRIASCEAEGYMGTAEINWIRDRIRPVLIVNGQEYPCGVFIATTPGKNIAGGREIWDIEAYSPLYLANRVQIEGAYTIPAGTNYIAAVQELLQLSGITKYSAEETDLVLASDRADWPVGTPVLTVINQLLSEINYRSAWVDLTGTVRLTKYTTPTPENIRHTYGQGQYSIISGDITTTTDYFDKANVFRAVCSSPDLEEPLVAVAENSDPESPYSTVTLGVRILREERVDSVPDLATLQERAEIMLTKSLQTTETVEFVTALCPVHETWDTVALDLDGLTGIFTETEWSMVLDASGEMRHRAERVIWK